MNGLKYFILKQERTKLIKNHLTADGKVELLDAIIDYINDEDEEACFRSDAASILFEVLIIDHDEMVEKFFD